MEFENVAAENYLCRVQQYYMFIGLRRWEGGSLLNESHKYRSSTCKTYIFQFWVFFVVFFCGGGGGPSYGSNTKLG